MVKNLPADAGDKGDIGSIPGLGRSPREGNGNWLQSSCLENPMDRVAWQVTVHGVKKSWTQLSTTHSPLVSCWLFAQTATQDLQPTSFPASWELRQELARQSLQFSHSTCRCRYQRQTPTCTQEGMNKEVCCSHFYRKKNPEVSIGEWSRKGTREGGDLNNWTWPMPCEKEWGSSVCADMEKCHLF